MLRRRECSTWNMRSGMVCDTCKWQHVKRNSSTLACKNSLVSSFWIFDEMEFCCLSLRWYIILSPVESLRFFLRYKSESLYNYFQASTTECIFNKLNFGNCSPREKTTAARTICGRSHCDLTTDIAFVEI